MATFGAFVGRRRLSKGISASTTSATRDARAAFSSIMKNYRQFVANVEEVTPDVLYAALEPTFELSQEYCPVDTGALLESGYLEIVGFRGKPKVEMGYGAGGTPEYTAVVHENMEWRHDPPTRAKWLQVALEEDFQNIQQRIIEGLSV